MLEAAIRIGFKAQIGIVPPRTTFDLTALDRTALPSRAALANVLGPPAAMLSTADAIAYQYCLAPCSANPSLIANMQFHFDRDGRLLRTQARYFRYAFEIDLMSPVATATIELH